MQTKKIGLILGPIAFLGTYFFASPEGLSESGTSLLAITFWIAIWWITEAIPIAATALLPLVIFPLTGVMGIKATSIPYSDPMVLLYMGGFMIAVSIEKWNLHKRIALQIISFLGTDLKKIILGFMVATAFLSMWISNTATSLMMLPIAIAVVMQVSQSNEAVQQTLGQSLMLGIAYSASIGGLATIIGTPTNVILVGVVKSTYGIEISFGEWMLIGFPIALGLLLICWYYLVNWAFHFPNTLKLRGGKEEIKRQLAELGPISRQEKRVLWVFIGVSFSWISRSFLLQQFVPALTDTIIALTGVLLLFVIPAGNEKKEQLLDWKVAEKIPWGILILFGGGLALAEGFQETGLANWIGEQFIQLQNFPFWLFLLLIIAAVNFLTEITSNVATASMLLPILAAVALAMGVHPYGLMIGATMAASCAFMLPVATPPNAVVFGSGYLTIPVMMRTGFFLNLLSIAFILMLILFYLPWIWNFSILVFPEGWK
ncbi:SLC13 family permease [Cyclobacterium xiamenense]|jgi:sodium-dependent dicarboxylate transporter 2/3/5|uniref:SLC13 family permease n=1 Tax=Cyclobacterium xiamenense TaxID=1297121 RepID=UPI0012B8F29C|nr:DASS family sodium-coupled anion symporter [Cyclobacterium xiamenense]